ncbi:MAG: carbohydrate ABC transporter permease [Faecousia sp.]
MKIGYHSRERLIKLLKTAVFMVLGIAFLLPLLWMISASLKTPAEIFAKEFHWFPETPRWDNYAAVWNNENVSMARGYLNSIFICVMSITVSLSLASLAAYAFAKIDFKGKNFVFMLFLSTMMIPVEVTMIPRFMVFNKIGLYNNLWAIILPHWFNASAIFLLRQFYLGLPNDLMEAAKIDGAGHGRIFLQIMLPLTKSALVSQCVLSFVSTWNEYLSPLIFLVKKNLYTISQVVQWTMMDEMDRTDLTMAAATCAVIPVIVVFFFCQRFFIEGIATSGVKG